MGAVAHAGPSLHPEPYTGSRESPRRAELAYTDSLCAAGCAHDIVQVSVSNDSVTVVGHPVVGMAKAVSIRNLRSSVPAGIHVTREQFGAAWPLTVDGGWVDCFADESLVFRTRSRTYALNGPTRSAGFNELEPIWRPNPNIEGANRYRARVRCRTASLRKLNSGDILSGVRSWGGCQIEPPRQTT